MDTIVNTGWKIEASRGRRDGTVSAQWYSRPDDQKFLSVGALYNHVKGRSMNTAEQFSSLKSEYIIRTSDDNDDLLVLSGKECRDYNTDMNLNNWSFTQLCNLIGAPSGYINRLPAELAADNLNHGLALRERGVTLYSNTTNNELLSITSPSYGRVHDHRIVEAVMKVAGNGTGDTRWKVPGAIDWSKGTYNPYVSITKDTTTLYASDRDVFLFLVDDLNPIEIGKLRNGEPDFVFRGFYVWNSEVGSKTMGISTFFLRGVCQNRNLWGVENQHTTQIRHTKNASIRLEENLEPALIQYANSGTHDFLTPISNAKKLRVANSIDDGLEWLSKQGFVKNMAQKVIETHVNEEETIPTTVWDFTQGITAVARGIGHTDVRIDLEKRAAKLLAKAA